MSVQGDCERIYIGNFFAAPGLFVSNVPVIRPDKLLRIKTSTRPSSTSRRTIYYLCILSHSSCAAGQTLADIVNDIHMSQALFSLYCLTYYDKQRFLTPGHQGWNDLHSLCRIGMEYYLLNNDDNNIIYWIMMIIMIMMMIIIMIIMMTMMIIGTATKMIMIIIITTTLAMTKMKMIMIKTAQTPDASHCIRIGVFKTKLPGIIDIIETMSC